MPSERAMEKAKLLDAQNDMHCRYCHNLGPDAHPAIRCNGDLEDCIEAVAEAIDAAVAEALEMKLGAHFAEQR